MFCIVNLQSSSQAGRRGFESRLWQEGFAAPVGETALGGLSWRQVGVYSRVPEGQKANSGSSFDLTSGSKPELPRLQGERWPFAASGELIFLIGRDEPLVGLW